MSPARSGVAPVVFAWSLAGGPASAADGVVEISQAQALADGVTPGDAAGFAVTLGQPGSDVPTGGVVVGSVNTSAIEVTADGVSLDLNGFRLAGAVACGGLGSQLLCGPGTGVAVSAAQRARVTVRNARVSGFGKGLDLGPRARVTQIHVASNGGTGIFAGPGSTVQRNAVRANTLHGLALASDASCRENTISGNGGVPASGGVDLLDNSCDGATSCP